jgi:hypothetical protein
MHTRQYSGETAYAGCQEAIDALHDPGALRLVPVEGFVTVTDKPLDAATEVGLRG